MIKADNTLTKDEALMCLHMKNLCPFLGICPDGMKSCDECVEKYFVKNNIKVNLIGGLND